jgi:hydroxymethylbilane synthase|tara:strand:+ start:365 stop:1276 length:912 start_codon:yes stop_codon:yes gene_type:complete
MKKKKILIGTRTSKLAIIYANRAKDELSKHFFGEIELVKIITEGDLIQKRRLSEIGGKGLFSKKIEEELLNKNIDLAVHALKDMPSDETSGLVTNCFLKRNFPEEILITRNKKKFNELKSNSVIGTSSFRREFQLNRIRNDINYKTIRGNVDTRISKLNNYDYDGILLSKAGISSLNLDHLISEEFSTDIIIPSAGQGTISIQCREDDEDIIKLLNKINNHSSSISALAERKVLNILEGDCHTPVGVFANANDDNFQITGELFSIDGKKRFFKTIRDKVSNYMKLSIELGNYLKAEAKDSYKK